MLLSKLYTCRKILSIFTCVIAILISNHSLALTLGDISLESTLNEILSADIKLFELDGLDETQIIVALWLEADYEQAGVEPLPLLNELDFDVEVLSNSQGLIRISSTDAIVDPDLNFVLSVRWPSGRADKEYTVLFDLPTFSVNPTLVPGPIPEPGKEEMPTPERRSETVVIQEGDSLWEIAVVTRPGNDISIQQMMLAIQRENANGEAFIRNNINGIRSGRILRIPNRQEINAISRDQAITQVAIQNLQFSNNAQRLVVNNKQGGANNNRDELSIVSNVDNEAEITGLNTTVENLENDLMSSEESLDRALLENEELISRLTALEEEIAILENIIAIENEQMAELQAELAAESLVAEVSFLEVPQDSTSASMPEREKAGVISHLLESTLGMISTLIVLLALAVGFLIARNRSAVVVEDEFDVIIPEEEAISEDDFEEFLEGADNESEEKPEESATIPESDIEFIGINKDDLKGQEEVIKAPSLLGNLGLDDTIAFDEGDEEELEVITDQDEVSTKLDLAVAYHAMGDLAGAKEILGEVIDEGNDVQIAEAQTLLSDWRGP